MKETKEFQTFQHEFKKYQQLFGLNGYKTYFKHEPIEDAYADIFCDRQERVATVRLSSLPAPRGVLPKKSVKQNAKHEALHLLLNTLESCARSRCIRDGEIYEASEEIVAKLENIIP